MKDLIKPLKEARSMGCIANTDLDKMLADNVKPALLKMSDEKRQKAVDSLKQMAEEG